MPVNPIMGLFAKSPIKPLQEHMTRVNECCSHLIAFFDATFEEDWDKAEMERSTISHIEKTADALKRDIRLKLPRGVFLPVDRNDMHELLTRQDRLANTAKDIAGQVYGRKLSIPEDMQDFFKAYLQRSLDASQKAQEVINEFDELLETGFKGREVNLVEEMIHQLDIIEDDTDYMQIQLRSQLFKLEPELNPVDVMFIYKILEWIGAIADHAQRVGSRLELMLARA
ncbi:TIGR00153 family protein [Vibrio sp.]|nr:TIGR00153 family protein [Vibrio sp.]